MTMGLLKDLTLFLRASIDLIRIDAALRRVGYQELMREIERPGINEAPSIKNRDIRRARRYGRRITGASRLSLPRVKCLHRSLVLHRWLRNEGMPSELRIGVIKGSNGLMAHAWVELGGHIVNDPPASIVPFTPLTRLQAPGATMEMAHMQWQ